MKRFLLPLMLLFCSSCELLMSPPAVAIEEEVAVDVLQAVEHELEKPKE